MSYVIRVVLTFAALLMTISVSTPATGAQEYDQPASPAAGASPEATPARSPLIPASCDVTLPNGFDPAHVEPPGTWVGKDGLYVGVPIDGLYVAKTEPDRPGGWNKHIWVRDVGQGALTVAVVPTGDNQIRGRGRAEPHDGSYVMEIWFPAEGCWEITGTTPQTSISVTVWVVFVNDWLATPAA